MGTGGRIFLAVLACGMFFFAYKAAKEDAGAFPTIICTAVGVSAVLWAVGIFAPVSEP